MHDLSLKNSKLTKLNLGTISYQQKNRSYGPEKNKIVGFSSNVSHPRSNRDVQKHRFEIQNKVVQRTQIALFHSHQKNCFGRHQRQSFPYFGMMEDRLQISLLILREFKHINLLLLPLKSTENWRFSDDFKRNRSSLIRLNALKGALSGLRQFLTTESPLRMMKNTFYFTSKALFVLEIFRFLS